MKILIIYDSVFGNTGKLAEAVAKTLKGEAKKVGDCTEADLEGLELLVAASPTRMFKAMPGVMASVKGLPAGSLVGVKVAAFDTRMNVAEADSKVLSFMAGKFGYAAEKLLKGLEKKGGTAAAEPAGFFVGGNEGPLGDGEEKRAVDWAKSL